MLSHQADNWRQAPFQHKVFNALALEKANDAELHDLFVGLTAAGADAGGGGGDDVTANATASSPSDRRLRKRDVAVRFHAVLQEIAKPAEIDTFVDQFWDYETEPLRGSSRSGGGGGAAEGGNAVGASAAAGGVVHSISEQEFVTRIKQLGQKTDSRMLPMAAIFGASGISIGIIIPVMPQLAQILTLSTTQ
jgi:hypothetical protein